MTTSTTVLSAAAILAGTITVSAQIAPQPAPAPVAPPGGMTVTVTGCLMPWDNTLGKVPPGAPGAPDLAARPGSTPMAGTRYVLLNAETTQAAETPAPPAGSQARTAAPQLSEFVVVPATGVNLAAHVKQQVAVTGTVASDATASHDLGAPVDSPASSTPPTTTGQKTMERKWATLTATSVTMVSATCLAKP